jgi:DNA-binding MarR family transcriptional regulator
MARDWKIHDDRPLPALLNEVKELAISELHARLAEEGHGEIRPGHGCVFRFVEREGSRLTELADRSGLTKQAVGEVVDDLVDLGYVERVGDPRDARAKLIRLTDRGWEGQATAQRIFADIEKRWAREIGREDMAGLRRTLEAIVAAGADAARAA